MLKRFLSHGPGLLAAFAVMVLACAVLATPDTVHAISPQLRVLTLVGLGAVLSTQRPTLLDITRAQDPDGSAAQVAEILQQKNPALEDMPFKEGNLTMGHRSTVRTGLPTPTWRKLYGGVLPTKGTTVQVDDSIGMLEDYAEVDKAGADLNGNTAAYRAIENKAHIQGMAHEMARALFYASEGTAPEQFTGFAPRFNSLSAENKDNIINAGGSGSDTTSIWLIGWGDDVFGIYPKGHQGAGITVTDKGQVTKENIDGAGGMAEMYRTHYRWDAGLVVRNWQYVVRIANIDISDLDTAANTKNIVTWMTQASEVMADLDTVTPVFYMSRRLRARLRTGILEKIAANLTWDNVAGKHVMLFDGIPVKRSDAIVHTETVIT